MYRTVYKILSLVLVLAMVFTISTPVFATPENDEGSTLGLSGQITEFAPIGEEFTPQVIAVGTTLEELRFPESLAATLLPDGEDAVATSIDITVSAWKCTTDGGYDSEGDGKPFTFAPELALPDGITLSEGVSVPNIDVTVGAVGMMPLTAPANVTATLHYNKTDGILYTKNDGTYSDPVVNTQYSGSYQGNGATLTLTNFEFETTPDNGIALILPPDVTIELVGDCSIRNMQDGEDEFAIFTTGDLKFTGDGSLTLVSDYDTALSIQNGALEIDGPIVSATGSAVSGSATGVTDYGGGAGITVTAGKLIAKGSDNGAINLDGGAANAVAVGSADGTSTSLIAVTFSGSEKKYKIGNAVAKYVELTPVPSGSLYFAEDASNTWGLWTDDAYTTAYTENTRTWSVDQASETLTLDGFTYITTAEKGLIANGGTINIDGDNSIASRNAATSSVGLSALEVTFTGSGTLAVSSGDNQAESTAIITEDTIIDGPTIIGMAGTASDSKGFASGGGFELKAGKLTAKGESCAVSGLSASEITGLIMKGPADGSASPLKDAVYDSNEQYDSDRFKVDGAIAKYLELSPAPPTVDGALYFGVGSNGKWSLWTDSSLTVEYTQNTNDWEASANKLTLKGLTFNTTKEVALTLKHNTEIVLADNTTSTIASVYNGNAATYGIQSSGTSLIISGGGTLIVSSGSSTGNSSAGITVTTEDLTVNGGTINVTAGNGTRSYGVWLTGVRSRITANGGTLNATAGNGSTTMDSIHPSSSGIYVTNNSIEVVDGSITAKGERGKNSYGVHCYRSVSVLGDGELVAISGTANQAVDSLAVLMKTGTTPHLLAVGSSDGQQGSAALESASTSDNSSTYRVVNGALATYVKLTSIDYTLYYNDQDGRLYTDSAKSRPYTMNVGNWEARDNNKTLYLKGFTFATTAPIALVMPSDTTISMSANSINRLRSANTGSNATCGIQSDGALTVDSDASSQLYAIGGDNSDSTGINVTSLTVKAGTVLATGNTAAVSAGSEPRATAVGNVSGDSGAVTTAVRWSSGVYTIGSDNAKFVKLTAPPADYTLFYNIADGKLYKEGTFKNEVTGLTGFSTSADFKTITLDGFHFATSAHAGLWFNSEITLVLADGSTNSVTSTYQGNKVSYGLFLTNKNSIKGKGSIDLTSGSGSHSYGLLSSGLIVTDATINATAGSAPESHGASVYELEIKDGGVLNARGTTKGIHSVTEIEPKACAVGTADGSVGSNQATWSGADHTYKIGNDIALYVSLTKPADFVAVTGITGVSTTGVKGVDIALAGTVEPTTATNKTITWSVKDAGATGASISGSTLSTTAMGTVVVTATISNGLTASSDYTQDFTITIKSDAKTLSSIAVTTPPDKTTYAKGELFDRTGMVITATYSDSTTSDVTGYTVSPATGLQTSDTSVTISYTEGAVTRTTTQAITVKADSAKKYTINLSVAPENSGAVSGNGEFDVNTSRTVTATPNSGYLFKNWTENGAEVSVDANYTFTLTGDRNLVANFIAGDVDVEVKPQGNAPVTTLPDKAAVEDAVLTPQDLADIQNGSEITITLEVKEAIPPIAEQEAVEDSLQGQTLGMYLAISLFKQKDNGTPESLTQLSKPIQIRFAVPAELAKSGRIFSVIRVHNGVAEILPNLSADPGYILIETDRFSTYALAYADATTPPPVQPSVQPPVSRPTGRSSSSGSRSGGSSGSSTTTTVRTATPSNWSEAAQIQSLIDKSTESYIRTNSTETYGLRKDAWSKLKGFQYQHDTREDKSVLVRLYISAPEKMAVDTYVTGWVKGKTVESRKAIFEKWFTNQVRVIHLEPFPKNWTANALKNGMNHRFTRIYATAEEWSASAYSLGDLQPMAECGLKTL